MALIDQVFVGVSVSGGVVVGYLHLKRILWEGYFAWDFALNDSSRRQMDSPGAPKASVPNVARARMGWLRVAEAG